MNMRIYYYSGKAIRTSNLRCSERYRLIVNGERYPAGS